MERFGKLMVVTVTALAVLTGCKPAPHKVGISGLIGPIDIPYGVPPYPPPGITRVATDNSGNLIESIGGTAYGPIGGGGSLPSIPAQTVLANPTDAGALPVGTTVAQINTMLGVVQSMPTNEWIGNVSGSTAAPAAVQVEDTVSVSGSAVTTLSFAGAFGGINGDTDIRYRVNCDIVLPASSTGVAYVFKINGGTANQFQIVRTDTGNGGGVAATAAAGLDVMGAGTVNAGHLLVALTLEAKTSSGVRFFHSMGSAYDGTTAAITHEYESNGFWNDSSTVITDFSIVATTSSMIGVGTFCRVRRAVAGG